MSFTEWDSDRLGDVANAAEKILAKLETRSEPSRLEIAAMMMAAKVASDRAEGIWKHKPETLAKVSLEHADALIAESGRRK